MTRKQNNRKGNHEAKAKKNVNAKKEADSTPQIDGRNVLLDIGEESCTQINAAITPMKNDIRSQDYEEVTNGISCASSEGRDVECRDLGHDQVAMEENDSDMDNCHWRDVTSEIAPSPFTNGEITLPFSSPLYSPNNTPWAEGVDYISSSEKSSIFVQEQEVSVDYYDHVFDISPTRYFESVYEKIDDHDSTPARIEENMRVRCLSLAEETYEDEFGRNLHDDDIDDFNESIVHESTFVSSSLANNPHQVSYPTNRHVECKDEIEVDRSSSKFSFLCNIFMALWMVNCVVWVTIIKMWFTAISLPVKIVLDRLPSSIKKAFENVLSGIQTIAVLSLMMLPGGSFVLSLFDAPK